LNNVNKIDTKHDDTNISETITQYRCDEDEI